MLQILFPSWRLFDDFQKTLTVQVRVQMDSDEWTPWSVWRPEPERRWFHIFANPHGLLFHLEQSFAERFLIEAQSQNDLPEVSPGLFSAKALNHRVRCRVSAQFPGWKRGQFQIVSVDPLESRQGETVVFRSEVFDQQSSNFGSSR